MSSGLGTFTIRNPNPSGSLWSKRPSMAALISPSPASFRFGSVIRPRSLGVGTLSISVSGSPIGIGRGLLYSRSHSKNRPVHSFAASHEDSPSDIEVVEEEDNSLKDKTEGYEEAWKQTLASFKQQALKMQSISQEAYEVYSKKGMVILKESSEKLKIQADKAREDLSVIAKELSEGGKVYLSTAAENSPEPVRDIVETFASSTDDLKDVSKVRDFYIGIPYGGLLSLAGFLSFMITGSISAIRFGVILGGALLALSIHSLRLWKKGESSSTATKGQAAIVTILFLRDASLLFSRPVIASFIALLVSGAVLAFYVYRIAFAGRETGGSRFEAGTES